MVRKVLCAVILVMLLAVSMSHAASMKPDVVLSGMNSVMAYSGLFNVMCNPPAYVGKIIKVKGMCDSVHDDETGEDYYGVVLMDGTMCCSLGVDFVLKSGKYPEKGKVITVMGRFEQYKYGEDIFCRLGEAELM